MEAVAMNHLGITVTDIDAAVKWYKDVLGFEHIIGPLDLVPDDSHAGKLAYDILGPRLKKGQFAHMKASNGVGLEIFSFDDEDAGPKEDNFEYWKNGIFHFAVTHSNPSELAAKIVKNGGKKRTEDWEIFPGSGRMLTYTQDPWGNIIEIYNYSYADTWAFILEQSESN